MKFIFDTVKFHNINYCHIVLPYDIAVSEWKDIYFQCDENFQDFSFLKFTNDSIYSRYNTIRCPHKIKIDLSLEMKSVIYTTICGYEKCQFNLEGDVSKLTKLKLLMD